MFFLWEEGQLIKLPLSLAFALITERLFNQLTSLPPLAFVSITADETGGGIHPTTVTLW